MYKNKAGVDIFYAYDGANGVPKTGDGGNITIYYSHDGVDKNTLSAPNITEIHATRHPGLYKFSYTAAEANADVAGFSPISSTANIQIRPIIRHTNTPASSLVDSIWDEATSGHTSAGTFGNLMGKLKTFILGLY